MTKKTAFSCALLLFALADVHAQEPVIDPAAIEILDHMSAVIGELSSGSFTLRIERDENNRDSHFVKHFSVDDVYLLGPDKMMVDSRSDKGHKGYWYDGQTVTYYSYDEHNYAIVDAPDTILETIYTVNRDYGIDFPAADFLYPTFTDDLIEHSDRIVFLGRRKVEGKDCFHILAGDDSTGIQFWISDDALTLPVKYSIANYHEENTPQYTATFSNWQLNPDLPSTIFDFVPPAAAAEIILIPKTEQ